MGSISVQFYHNHMWLLAFSPFNSLGKWGRKRWHHVAIENNHIGIKIQKQSDTEDCCVPHFCVTLVPKSRKTQFTTDCDFSFLVCFHKWLLDQVSILTFHLDSIALLLCHSVLWQCKRILSFSQIRWSDLVGRAGHIRVPPSALAASSAVCSQVYSLFLIRLWE